MSETADGTIVSMSALASVLVSGLSFTMFVSVIMPPASVAMPESLRSSTVVTF